MAKILNAIDKTQKPEEKQDKIFRIEEMIDEMQKSIDNVRQLSDQQNKLVDIINNSEFKDSFVQFVEEITAQNANLLHQVVELENRKCLLERVVFAAKNDESAKELIALVLDSFGVFDN